MPIGILLRLVAPRPDIPTARLACEPAGRESTSASGWRCSTAALGPEPKFRLLMASILLERDQIPVAISNGELHAPVRHRLQGPRNGCFAGNDGKIFVHVCNRDVNRSRKTGGLVPQSALLARSATSSTPQKKPRPRMSLTCGCAPRALRSARPGVS